ncbi:MAG: hypothetical protein IJV39_05250 [Ruminococcus sp.]|nr:hypothetical protein [Ruminococcus sp.]
MKRLAIITAMALLISLTLFGCGKSDSVVGEWTITSIIKADGTQQSYENYCTDNGIDASKAQAVYNFEEDGKFGATVLGIKLEGTYTIDDTKISAVINGNTTEFEFDADKDTLTSKDSKTGISSVLTRTN